MRAVFALFLICTFLPGQTAVDETKAIREFRKEFASTPKRSRTPDERAGALKHLAGLDSAKVAEALATAFDELDQVIARLDEARTAINAEIAEIIKGKEFDAQRRLDQDKYKRYHELQQRSDATRAEVDSLRQVQSRVGEMVRSLQKEESLAWLVKNVINNKKYGLVLKVTVAARAGGLDQTLLDELGEALKRARQPHDFIALLEGIGHIGVPAAVLADPILKLLKHKDGSIQEAAALCLGKLRVLAAVEPMIEVLATTKGQRQKRVSVALEELTGQQHGISVASWRGWWEAEGKALVAAGKPPVPIPGNKTMTKRSEDERSYYMGIPQDGEAIVYVIDSSGSMQKPVTWRKPGPGGVTVAGGGADGKLQMSRLEACKMELIEALGKLDRSKTFNVLWYSDLPHVWGDGMQPAQPNNIRDAQEWVRQLQPNSMTNIHDAMQAAFAFAKGRGVKDKAYGEVGVDTIFLLSDGSPTKPDGTLDDTEKILVAVRQWNPLKRVTIHTIGIGSEMNVTFMQQLANENNGQFRHYTDSGESRR